MSKRARRLNRIEARAAADGAIVAANDNKKGASIQAFTFGDPEPVLSRATMLDMLECYHNQRWYEPPVSLHGLARAYRCLLYTSPSPRD